MLDITLHLILIKQDAINAQKVAKIVLAHYPIILALNVIVDIDCMKEDVLKIVLLMINLIIVKSAIKNLERMIDA
jgi:hypothetical protein